MEKLKITLIDTDDMNEDNHYYLYEIKSDHAHYYICTSDEELNENAIPGEVDYSNEYRMHKREDFTDREWEIAKYLFNFLWDSSNGTNTCVEEEIYQEDGFNREEIFNFIDKFNFERLGVLDTYEEGGVEIYWAYFSCFDLNSCNFWEDCSEKPECDKESTTYKYLIVFDRNEVPGAYLDSFDTIERAREYRDNYNSKKLLTASYGKVHIEVETVDRKTVE